MLANLTANHSTHTLCSVMQSCSTRVVSRQISQHIVELRAATFHMASATNPPELFDLQRTTCQRNRTGKVETLPMRPCQMLETPWQKMAQNRKFCEDVGTVSKTFNYGFSTLKIWGGGVASPCDSSNSTRGLLVGGGGVPHTHTNTHTHTHPRGARAKSPIFDSE